MTAADAIAYKNLKAAEYDTLMYGYEIALELSSGPYSLKTLAGMGHPYSRAHLSPHPPAYIINEQTGVFKRSWRLAAFFSPAKGVVIGHLENISFEARMLEAGGTSKSRMIARPFMQVLERKMEPVRIRNIEAATLKTITEVAALNA